MEEERRELKHILISYLPCGDLDEIVKEYENIIGFIANYFTAKSYKYVIAREPIINERLKEDSIPKSKIKEKIEELKISGVTRTLNDKNELIEEHYFLQDEIDILQELLEEE